MRLPPFSFWKAAGSAPFDPATLAFSDWRMPDFGGLPWAANASAGTSGTSIEGASRYGNSVTPVAGRVLNGFTPARYTSGAKGSSPLTGLTRITPTDYSLSALIYIESAGAQSVATPYEEQFIYGEGTGFGWQVTLSSSGLKVSRYNGATWDSVVLACATGAWKLVDVRQGGGNVELQVNRGGWNVAAFGNAVTGNHPNTGGAVYNIAATTDYNLMERFIAPTRFSDANFDDWADYINAKYGTSF